MAKGAGQSNKLMDVNVPSFPESVADGTVVTWHKKVGDAVKRDEVIVDIETDKVVFEVPSPQDGVVADILEDEGATVLSGQVLAHINVAADGTTAAPVASDAQTTDSAADTSVADEVIVAPAARRMIDERGLDIQAIDGTGRGGRVLKEDVMRYITAQSGSSAEPVADAVTSSPSPARSEVSVPSPATVSSSLSTLSGRTEKRVPMTRLRARIAERLLGAQQNAAILTTFNEVDMRAVMALRQKYKELFEKQHGSRLGFMSFFIKAALEALKRFPLVNASIDGNDVVYHGFFDVGVAVSSPRGLVVPIIRDADQLSMAAIESAITDYAQKAQAGTLSLDDLTGGTFTITNGGVFGSLLSTPILNPPQSAILGMHKIQQRPVVENGEIVIGQMMYLALSYDHRIIDGRDAVQFLVTIKDLLEDPSRLLLEI